MSLAIRSPGTFIGNGRKYLRAAAALAALCAGGVGLLGCVASGEAQVVADYPVIEVTTVPVQIEAYPRVYYEGSYAYLVDGHWYYRSHNRWVTFRREPPTLVTFRADYNRRRHVQTQPGFTAPPAHPHHHHY